MNAASLLRRSVLLLSLGIVKESHGITQVENGMWQLIMYVSVGTTLVQKGDGVTILPMTGSHSLLCCPPHLGETEHSA